MKAFQNESQFYTSFTDLLALLLVFFIYLTALNSMQTISDSPQIKPLNPEQFQPVKTVYSIQDLEALVLSVQDHVLFSVGSIELTDSAKKALRELAKVVVMHPVQLRIAGHADPRPIHRPIIQSNWHLSALRASSVAYFLQQEGVPRQQLVIMAHGETDLESLDRHGLNRRVEIQLEAL